jgi:hypothetical protein
MILDLDPALVNWLVTGAFGPALAALPVNWSAGQLGGLASRWLDRIRHEDGLSRLILAADPPVRLTRSDLAAVRRLLKDPQTWQLMGGGTVEDLAIRIGACLPGVEDAGGDRMIAGRAIARGLVEFAVFNLEPELFQRVLMTRIARMETRQGNKLDEVVLQLHAGLAAFFANQGEADELRVHRVLTQLAVVLDRLPPGPAGVDEVSVYLAALIGWLNADPWLRDPRLGGSVLTPAIVERKLAIRTADEVGDGGVTDDGELDAGEELDPDDECQADDLTDTCARLVILGGPGSGKTWLARRAARRCAEAALQDLTSGGALDEVELPLYTTCSLLAAAPGGIRDAAVSSALDQLPDLGSSRITVALQEFFTNRSIHSATLLVIDSLDEASNPGNRLRQADTLPWRIVLTSRPSSWRNQLSINSEDRSHQLGSLRRLRYPEDVESIIEAWFAADPAQGRALAKQIRSRADLQKAATVPLILAFYCIIGAEAVLPATRHEVYAQVLGQLLSGLWRDEGGDSDPEGSLARLRGWAWDGAVKDEITGRGVWADEILTPYVRLSDPERAAVDHVAVPVRPPDLATGATLRRFVHRSIREHLTAVHVATQMSAAEAAAELLNHLWYDLDWQYVAPAALAMHPQRDQVLADLICRAARAPSTPANLDGIDGCWELRRFLARVALESREADWTAESAAIISRARVDVTVNGRLEMQAAPGWPTADRELQRLCLNDLDDDTLTAEGVIAIADILGKTNAEPHALARARAVTLSWLEMVTPNSTRYMTWALQQLRPEPDDLARARGYILNLLDNEGDERGSTVGLGLVQALGWLSPGPGDDLARARSRVLNLMEHSAASKYDLALALGALDPGPDDLAQARRPLLDELDAEDPGGRPPMGLLSQLSPTPNDLARVRARVLSLLATADGGWYAQRLAEDLGELDPEPGDLARARGSVLHLLDDPHPQDTPKLVEALGMLRPEPGDLSHARARVLSLLETASPGDAEGLVKALGTLRPEPDDLARARARVLSLLDDANPRAACHLAGELGTLDPEPDDLARARARMLSLLDADDPLDVWLLSFELSRLSPEPNDLARARAQVMSLLDAANPKNVINLADALSDLRPDPSDLTHARARVLSLLRKATNPYDVHHITVALEKLSPEPRDLAQVCSRVLGLLDTPGATNVNILVEALSFLSPEPDVLAGARARARARILSLLGEATDPRAAEHWLVELAQLSPVAHDLTGWKAWALAPGEGLLALARQNSPINSWLEALPALADLPT